MDYRIGIDIGSDTLKAVIIAEDEIDTLSPIKIKGKPLEKLKELLDEIHQKYGGSGENTFKAAISGRGSQNFSKLLGLERVDDIDGLVAAVNRLHPEVRHIIEIGAESQSYLSLFKDEKTKKLLIDDVIPGGKCAGGCGSFLDYMHKRLKYDSLDEFIEVGLSVENPAGISGRCAVFAESDIVHHYQKGTPKERIVAGIHQAVARNYKSLIHKSKAPMDKVAVVGGVAANKCLKYHITKELNLKEEQLVTPELNLYFTAIGAAMKAEKPVTLDRVRESLSKHIATPFEYASMAPIKLERSVMMKPPAIPPDLKVIEKAALGVDIGSVSTKAALITIVDGEVHVLASHYRRTEGNPINAVKMTLQEIRDEIAAKGFQIKDIKAATTGSGRYLTGYFIGASKICDEITAQARGAATYFKDREVTIIEIGGQDSKFIQLDGRSILDFEMNWACAAGTGALIEKHAKNLDIDVRDFGGTALKGDKPPLINSTCAVFSESALVHFQQNNVSIENLCAGACLASAKNYLVKVVRNRPISECVAFQGAVAFNRGMVGSFETLLDRPILVPPYPHLTGAIGVASLALEECERETAGSHFRGFEQILGAEYSLSSFQCNHCNNECQINRFTVGSETFFQGDRCDRYSSSHKKSKTGGLPDLFEEREEMLMSAYEAPEEKKLAGTVGIPRGILFSDYYPFFNAFFSELGFKVIPSERTSKRIVAKGIDLTVAEPCFPVKVAHGHAAELYEQEPDYLFIPAIITAEKPVGKYSSCVTCPYVQSIPDVLKSALSDRKNRTVILSPTFFFDRGERHVKRVMRELASQLGKSAGEAQKAYETARKTLQSFREKIQARGREVLESLKDGQTAFVIIGRPYAVHDRAVNMDVAKKVLDEGYLPIPLDYLPLGDFDTSSSWPNIYSVQGQKKLAAARMIAESPNLHALVITYFGCGPDAFLDQMFKEQLGTHYLTIQIDEHTSDTGIITRIQAYLNSAGRERGEKAGKPVSNEDTAITEIQGKRLWIPDMNKGSWVLASVMRAFGIDAKALPRSNDPGLSLARKYICGDVCLPMLHTSEDMLQRAMQKDFDPAMEAFFQGKSGGPCRYGMYFMLEKSILDMLHGKVDLVTIGNRNNSGGLGSSFIITVWDTLVTHDIIEKMLFHTRPYEMEKGAADSVFDEYIAKLCRCIEEKEYRLDRPGMQLAAIVNGGHLAPLRKIIRDARDAFAAVRDEKVRQKPHVGVVGEFFVRLHGPSNQNIIRRIEALGGEVWLAPLTEFFAYSNYISAVHAVDRWRDEKKIGNLTEALMRNCIGNLAVRNEHILEHEGLPYLKGLHEPPPAEVVESGSRYINRFFGGEAILSLGKSEDFARHKLDGIVSVGPFNCMPSLIVSAISRELRKLHGNIPFLNIDFDGYEDSIRDDRISMFMSQVKERHSIK